MRRRVWGGRVKFIESLEWVTISISSIMTFSRFMLCLLFWNSFKACRGCDKFSYQQLLSVGSKIRASFDRRELSIWSTSSGTSLRTCYSISFCKFSFFINFTCVASGVCGLISIKTWHAVLIMLLDQMTLPFSLQHSYADRRHTIIFLKTSKLLPEKYFRQKIFTRWLHAFFS